MELFHKVVLAIAGIIFVIAMGFVLFYAIQFSKTKQAFPPSTNTCPDLWASSMAADGTIKCYYTGYNNGNFTSNPDYATLNNDSTKKTYLGSTDSSQYTSYTDENNLPHTAIYANTANADKWGSTGTLTCNQNTWASTNNIVWSGVNETSC